MIFLPHHRQPIARRAATLSPPEYLYMGTERRTNQGVYWPSHIWGHHLCAGSSGSGKSRYLLFLLELYHELGANLFVMEPHRSLIASMLRALAKRPSTSQKTIYFAPFAPDQQHVLGFQPIPQDVPAADQWYVALVLVEAILTAFGQRHGFESPRTARVLYNICLPVLASGRGVLGMEAFLNPAKKSERKAMLKFLGNDHAHVISDWELFDSLNTTRQSEFLEGPANRLRFLLMPTLKNLFAHPKPLNLKNILEEKGVTVLIDLYHYNRVPKDLQRLLGVLFLQELYRLGLGRNIDVPDKLTTNHIVVDEANLFLSDSLAGSLEELRKAKLFYVLALQGLSQCRKESSYLLDSVLTNTRIKTCFQVSSDDADVLVRNIEKVDPYALKYQEPVVRYKPIQSLQEVISTSFSETSSETFVSGMSQSHGERATYSIPTGSNVDATSTGTSTNNGQSNSQSHGNSVTKGETRTLSPVTLHEEITDWKQHYFPLNESLILAAQNLVHQGVGECVFKADNLDAVHLKVKHIEPAPFHPQVTPFLVNNFLAMIASARPDIYRSISEVQAWMKRFDDTSPAQLPADTPSPTPSAPRVTAEPLPQEADDATPKIETVPAKRGLFKRR